MKFGPILAAWTTLALALLAWVSVVFFALSIDGMAQSDATQQGTDNTQSDQQSALVQNDALARAIAPERQALENALPNNPLTIASSITQAGTDAGVTLSVSSAQPESTSAAASNAGAQLVAIDFAVEGQGTFQQLTRAALLLAQLPLPSSIQQLDISRVPASATGGLWELNVQLRVLSSASLSS